MDKDRMKTIGVFGAIAIGGMFAAKKLGIELNETTIGAVGAVVAYLTKGSAGGGSSDEG